MSKVNIIAEIGVNHDGKIEKAIKLIQIAKRSGADSVKFQTFSADHFVKINAKKTKYQLRTTPKNVSHYEMLKKLELSAYDFARIAKFCKKLKIEFLSTPYDPKSVDLLEKLKVKRYKVASSDLVDLVLHKKIISTKKPVIISTGASNLDEIKKTLDFYKKNRHNKISLLHCVSNYPCSLKNLNMLAILKLKELFKLPVGYSDHTNTNEAAKIAVALGANIIEKHLTLNNNLKGPDHKASADPKNFLSYVSSIRNVELILGSKEKKIQNEETSVRRMSRKSITLKNHLKKNTILKLKDIVMKRPGIGLNGQFVYEIIGKKVRKDLSEGYQIKMQDLY